MCMCNNNNNIPYSPSKSYNMKSQDKIQMI